MSQCHSYMIRTYFCYSKAKILLQSHGVLTSPKPQTLLLSLLQTSSRKYHCSHSLTLLSTLIQVIIIMYLFLFLDKIPDIFIRIPNHLVLIVLELYQHCFARSEYRLPGIQNSYHLQEISFCSPRYLLKVSITCIIVKAIHLDIF